MIIHLTLLVFAVTPCWIWGAEVDCQGGCPIMSSRYNITCTASGSGNMEWYRGGVKIVTCFTSLVTCTPETSDYNGHQINNTYFILEIKNLSSSDNTVDWECRYGLDSATCAFSVSQDVPRGTLEADCRAVGDDGHEGSCFGVTDLGTPAATLLLEVNGQIMKSTNTSLTLDTILPDGDDANIAVSMTGQNEKCLLNPAKKKCPDTRPSKKSGLAFVIITAVLLLLGIMAFIVVSVKFGAKEDGKRQKLRLSCLIIGPIWIVIGLIGTIVVLVIGSQVQPGSVLPAGSITIVGVVFSVITLLAGLGSLLFAGCFLSGENLSEGKIKVDMNKQAEPLNDHKENKQDQNKEEEGKTTDLRM